MIDNVFIREVEDQCDRALCELGAKRPRRGNCYFELNKNFLCWIGLNQGRHEDFLRINPFVGIHVVSVMKMKQELTGVKYKRGQYASISTHLGNLCPDIDQFQFDENTDIEAEAIRLAKAIHEFGIPYARQFMTYETILPEFKVLIPTLGGYPERYAITLFLSGQIEETKQFIADCKEKYRMEESENTQLRFEAFAESLLKKIDLQK